MGVHMLASHSSSVLPSISLSFFIKWHTETVVRLQPLVDAESQIILWLQQTIAGGIDVNSFYKKLQKSVVKPLAFVRDWAGFIPQISGLRDDHESLCMHHDFVLELGFGPGGVSRLIHIFSCVYGAVARVQRLSCHMNPESKETERFIMDTSQSMLYLVFYMRAMIHRSLYDPSGGFRELAHILRIHDSKLPVCQCQPV